VADPVGSGSALKLVVNLTVGVATAAVGEALRLAADLGLDRAAVVDVLAAGSPVAATVAPKAAMLTSGEYGDAQFTLDLLVKDLGLVLGAAPRDLPATRAALDAARAAAAAGHGAEDCLALAGHLADGAGGDARLAELG